MKTVHPYTGVWTLHLLIPVPVIAPYIVGDYFYIEFSVAEIRIELAIRWIHGFHKYDTNGFYIRNKFSLYSKAKPVWE